MAEFNRRNLLRGALLGGASLGASAFGVARAQDKEEGPLEAAQRVPRRQLGTTGEEIPILLFGCAQKFDPTYDKMLHRGFKEGVDYLDTALVYANGESHRTLKPFIEQVGRDKLWITSKAPHHGNRATVQTFEDDLNTCLEQMQVDHLDLFFMHGLNTPRYLKKEFIQMGERLKKQGKTRFFGFSCHAGNVVMLLETAARVGGIDAIMFRYNFTKYGDRALNRAIDACKQAGIGLIAMKTQQSLPADMDEVSQFQSKNFNLAQAKLKAVWADERIDSAVSHMDNLQKLEENVAAAKSPVKLGMHEFQQLQRLATCTSHLSCQGCNHLCESRIDGEVQVADTLRYLMYYEGYGERQKARSFYQELSPAQRQLEGIDFAAAMQACPEGIDIPARLARARELLG